MNNNHERTTTLTMKNPRSLVLLTAIGLIACNAGGQGGAANVDVEIAGAGGQWLYFERFENNRPVKMDSVKLDGQGKGRITMAGIPLDFYRIALNDQDALIISVDSTASLSVRANAGSLGDPQAMSGFKHSELLLEFHTANKGYERERDSLRNILRNDQGNSEALERINALNAEFYELTKRFVSENQGSPAIITAVGRLRIQEELELYKKSRESLRQTMPHSSIFAMFRDQVDRMEQQEVMRRQQEEQMARLSNLLPIGSEAPDIRQNTPQGGSYALSQMRGKVVLIDFWASWCRPCRIDNPHVKKLYEKYNKKGFDILGVSLDRSHDAWVGAIQADGLPWKHVSDLGFWNNAAAQEYGVHSIPYTVLIDRDGKIIAKGLRGQQLEAKLAEIFGS